MKFSELDASGYKPRSIFYKAEFEALLIKIIFCYHLMLSDRVSLINDENSIRDVILKKYLKNNEIRKKVGLINYLFDREVPEDNSIGRTDIKIQTLNSFFEANAYYIIECKRLDDINTTGSSGLNAKYIKNGICRFITKSYSTYYKVNGMIGFVVAPIDLNKNVKKINKLIKSSFIFANTIQLMYNYPLNKNFKFSYYSKHKVDSDKIILYHLMFDFSNNIR